MHTRITLNQWNWLNRRITRTVDIEVNKDGYWRKRSQRALIAALKATKGIEVKDA